MTGAERIRAAVAFETPDRVPVLAHVFGHAAVLAGVELGDYVRDGQLLAHCQLAARDRYDLDAVFALMDANVETEALGSVLRYRRSSYPIVERYAVAPNGDGIERLRPSEAASAGRIPTLLEATRELRAALGDDVLVIGCVSGPMTVAAQLMGLEAALYLAIDDPGRSAAKSLVAGLGSSPWLRSASTAERSIGWRCAVGTIATKRWQLATVMALCPMARKSRAPCANSMAKSRSCSCARSIPTTAASAASGSQRSSASRSAASARCDGGIAPDGTGASCQSPRRDSAACDAFSRSAAHSGGSQASAATPRRIDCSTACRTMNAWYLKPTCG